MIIRLFSCNSSKTHRKLPKNSRFRMISTYHKCFCSGILACIGSVFAKWAFGDILFDDIYNFKIVAIRLISLFCMIYFNTKGLTLFIENLKVWITENCLCKVGCVFSIVFSLLLDASWPINFGQKDHREDALHFKSGWSISGKLGGLWMWMVLESKSSTFKRTPNFSKDSKV